MPEVREFIRDSPHLHADTYSKLKVTFIHGRNPELFIRDDNGELIETVDISKLSIDEIHRLLRSKGFERDNISLTDETSAEEEDFYADTVGDEF
jgi:hypothetical protein